MQDRISDGQGDALVLPPGAAVGSYFGSQWLHCNATHAKRVLGQGAYIGRQY